MTGDKIENELVTNYSREKKKQTDFGLAHKFTS